jgi:hypothetical protein
MARTADHTFHTRHDFTPEFGWAAFQLLYEIDRPAIAPSDLEKAARNATSPLARLGDLSKVLASLEELGLLSRDGKTVGLTEFGRALASGLGAYETGFRAAVHGVYAWKWLWDKDHKRASPPWSYRQVCSQLLASPPTGIAADDLVLRVVDAAGVFKAERVSFSRSSVSGVVHWLAAQTPPLVEMTGKKVTRARGQITSPTMLRVNLAAMCALEGGPTSLDGKALELLAEAVLVPPDELWLSVVEYVRDSAEFTFIPGGRGTVAFNRSDDAFIQSVFRVAQRSD